MLTVVVTVGDQSSVFILMPNGVAGVTLTKSSDEHSTQQPPQPRPSTESTDTMFHLGRRRDPASRSRSAQPDYPLALPAHASDREFEDSVDDVWSVLTSPDAMAAIIGRPSRTAF